MLSDYVQLVDSKAWRDNEMQRLVSEGVLEVVSIRAKRKKKPKKPLLTERHVYIMRAGDHHKIGYAVSPTNRRREIQVGSPVPVEIIHSVKTNHYRRLERMLHRYFKHCRVSGEWFTLDAEGVTLAIALMGAPLPTSLRLTAPRRVSQLP